MSKNKQKVSVDRVRELAAEGHSQSMIAKLMGVTSARICQICKRKGIKTLILKPDNARREALAQLAGRDDISAAEAAQLAGYSQSGGVYAFRSMGLVPPHRRTKGDNLRELATKGYTLTQAARQVGWSAQLAFNEAKRLGIIFHVKHKHGDKTE